jgi:hypothetical protein
MDFYISRFYEFIPNCKVADYSVYLEKKHGVARLNPLSAYSQLVIYVTDKGSYCLKVNGSGEFGFPEYGGFEMAPDGKITIYKGKTYNFSRKYKNGRYSTLGEFAEAASL